jgi:hypothetical protein
LCRPHSTGALAGVAARGLAQRAGGNGTSGSELEEDEDLLREDVAAPRAPRSAAAAAPKEAWQQPRFVQRSQAAAPSTQAGAPGGFVFSRRAVERRPAPPAPVVPPRPRMPELYAGLELPPAARVRALAKGAVEAAGYNRRLTAGFDYVDGLGFRQSGSTPADVISRQGISVDYCVFCYHGTHFLQAEVRGKGWRLAQTRAAARVLGEVV